MEWSFFVTEAALNRLRPNADRDEASLLRAFDANRQKIYVAATKAYKRERKGFTNWALRISERGKKFRAEF